MSKDMEFDIQGATTDLLTLSLKPGESIYVETGSLVSMDNDITLQATMSDGTDVGRNIFSRFFQIFKRRFIGGTFFLTRLTNTGDKNQEVTITPGESGSQVLPVLIGREILEFYIIRGYFLGATSGVSIGAGIKFKPISSMMGSAELVLNKLSGKGYGFIKSKGPLYVKELEEGEKIKVDEHSLIGLTKNVNYSVHVIKGQTNRMFAGEGYILYELEGPGSVVLQAFKREGIKKRKRHQE